MNSVINAHVVVLVCGVVAVAPGTVVGVGPFSFPNLNVHCLRENKRAICAEMLELTMEQAGIATACQDDRHEGLEDKTRALLEAWQPRRDFSSLTPAFLAS